jgi:hypothetical protein
MKTFFRPSVLQTLRQSVLRAIIILIFIIPARGGEVFDGLRYLYPNAEFFKDFEVRDEIIIKWDAARLGPQPSSAQITQAAADARAARLALQQQRQTEATLLENARLKLAADQDLTPDELRAVLRALIRRSQATQQLLQTLR